MFKSFIKAIAIAVTIASVTLVDTNIYAQEPGITIEYRSFSGVPTIGAPADEYTENLAQVSRQLLGKKQQLNFQKISPKPEIPDNDIIAAVGTRREASQRQWF